MEKDIWEQLMTALRFLDCTRVGKGMYSLSLKSASFSLACCCVTGLLPGLSQSHLNNFHFYCQSGGEKKDPQNQISGGKCSAVDLLCRRSLRVYVKGSRVELYFTELFWTNANFCAHALFIPVLICVRVNCTGMACLLLGT